MALNPLTPSASTGTVGQAGSLTLSGLTDGSSVALTTNPSGRYVISGNTLSWTTAPSSPIREVPVVQEYLAGERLSTQIPITFAYAAGQGPAPGPGSPATAENQDELETILDATLYLDKSITSLSSGQAAGTTAVIPANPRRKLFAITPVSDGGLYLASFATGKFFFPLYAGVTKLLTGPDCPTNAMFVTGQAQGAALPMAEG